MKYDTFYRTSMAGGLLILACASFLLGCATGTPPEVVADLSIEQYMGRWYEIAKYPVFFERGLVGVTAEYALEEDGRVRLTNRGLEGSFDGPESVIQGYASVPDPATPAKLRIRFDPFPASLFAADYWIIDIAEDYSYAVVSNPRRSVLWILSRTPALDEEVYTAIVVSLEARGFDIGKLERMPQPEG